MELQKFEQACVLDKRVQGLTEIWNELLKGDFYLDTHNMSDLFSGEDRKELEDFLAGFVKEKLAKYQKEFHEL